LATKWITNIQQNHPEILKGEPAKVGQKRGRSTALDSGDGFKIPEPPIKRMARAFQSGVDVGIQNTPTEQIKRPGVRVAEGNHCPPQSKSNPFIVAEKIRMF